MSIENNLASIAASLATIAEALKNGTTIIKLPHLSRFLLLSRQHLLSPFPTPSPHPLLRPSSPRRFRLHLPARSPTKHRLSRT